MRNDLIINFATRVRSGFGTIKDSIVKEEFERVYETSIASAELAALLALLEKHELMDKKNSVNKQTDFYQSMFQKMKRGI